MLPETRLNKNQVKLLNEKYSPLIDKYDLNEVTVTCLPTGPTASFCNDKRLAEITDELLRSEADLLVLLGDLPIKQYLKQAADISFRSLKDYVDKFGYGNKTEIFIGNKKIRYRH